MFSMPHALWLTLAMLVLGAILRVLKTLPDNASDVLNKLVLHICLPALIINVLCQLQLSASLLWVPVIAWAVMGASALVVHLLAQALKWTREVQGALLLTAVLGNTAFLGYPLCRAYLGESSLGTAVLYDQLGSFLVFASFGLWVSASYSGASTPGLGATIKRIITFPAFIALVIGITLNSTGVPLPAPIFALFADLAQLLVPLAMLAVGLNFSLAPPAGQSTPLIFGLAIKMLLAPLIALGLSHWLLSKAALQVVALEAAMPPMVTAAALAANAKLAPKLAAAMAGFGILLAIVWLPLLFHWLR